MRWNFVFLSCCGTTCFVVTCSSRVADRSLLFRQQATMCQVGVACYNGLLFSFEITLWRFRCILCSYIVEFGCWITVQYFIPLLTQLSLRVCHYIRMWCPYVRIACSHRWSFFCRLIGSFIAWHSSARWQPSYEWKQSHCGIANKESNAAPLYRIKNVFRVAKIFKIFKIKVKKKLLSKLLVYYWISWSWNCVYFSASWRHLWLENFCSWFHLKRTPKEEEVVVYIIILITSSYRCVSIWIEIMQVQSPQT
jgi:hypothetical protein